VFVILFITHYGDPPPTPGIVVDNRTSTDVTIYVHVSPQQSEPFADVPAHSRVATDITCGALEMTAEDSAGHVIAQRGPFPSCHSDEWVIQVAASPVSSLGP